MTDLDTRTHRSLTEAARALSASYPQAMRLLLTGRLQGQKEDGRWRITTESIRNLRAEQATTREAA